ncbi:hypothetical protein [Achromobacter insolitus]|uniref:hypothetical protein n=1 Tax=Achromobacter insolitus TaxID=217204 RepID=UPI0007C20DA9|nr:hypothetical protein [Achromobacter insolitus]OAD16479.1 hypothetical protein A3839_28430 [Achromobacter insolitus]
MKTQTTGPGVPPLDQCYQDEAGIAFVQDGTIICIAHEADGHYDMANACELCSSAFDTPQEYDAYVAKVRAACSAQEMAMNNANEELAARLAEGGLSNEDAQKFAARLVYLGTRYSKLAEMASDANYDRDDIQEDMDDAKETLRELVWRQVGEMHSARLEALESSKEQFLGWQKELESYELDVAQGRDTPEGDARAEKLREAMVASDWTLDPDIGVRLRDGVATKVIGEVDFGFDPRAATVRVELLSGRANRMDGKWGIAVSQDAMDALDGDLLLSALTWKERLKDALTLQGQDPKYLDQIIGRMQVEKVASLDDAEIQRAFKDTVLSDFCIKYAKAARECGLWIDDLYPEAAMDRDIEELSHRDDGPSPL